MDTSTFIALCALAVSVISTFLATWTAVTQRRHMRLSVRPIAAVTLADFEDRIGVFLQNKGIGPMRVVSLRASGEDGVTLADVISHMPPLRQGILWSGFRGGTDGAALEAGKRLELLLLEGDPGNAAFTASRDLTRRSLARLTIRVEYEDLYGQAMDPYERELSWFGRHWPNPVSGANDASSQLGGIASGAVGAKT